MNKTKTKYYTFTVEKKWYLGKSFNFASRI